MLASRVVGTGDSTDQRALKHLVVDGAWRITRAQVGSGQRFDVGRCHRRSNAVEVLDNRVIRRLVSHLHNAVQGDLFGDLVTHLGQGEVKPLGALDWCAVYLDALGKGVVAVSAVAVPQQVEQLCSIHRLQLRVHR